MYGSIVTVHTWMFLCCQNFRIREYRYSNLSQFNINLHSWIQAIFAPNILHILNKMEIQGSLMLQLFWTMLIIAFPLKFSESLFTTGIIHQVWQDYNFPYCPALWIVYWHLGGKQLPICTFCLLQKVYTCDFKSAVVWSWKPGEVDCKLCE